MSMLAAGESADSLRCTVVSNASLWRGERPSCSTGVSPSSAAPASSAATSSSAWRARGAVITAVGRHADQRRLLRPMGDVGQIAPHRRRARRGEAPGAAVAGADAVINAAASSTSAARSASISSIIAGRRGWRGGARGRDQAASSMFRRIGADPALALGLCPHQGRGRGGGARRLPRRRPAAPLDRVRPGGRVLQPLCRAGADLPALPLIGGGQRGSSRSMSAMSPTRSWRRSTGPRRAGRTYELGGPDVYSFRELMEIC